MGSGLGSGSGFGLRVGARRKQRTEPLSDLPHEPRVVDVLVDRRLVASVEEDGPRRVGRRAEPAARAAARPPPLVVKAEPLREGAACITEVVNLLREVLPRTVHDGRTAGGTLGLPPAADEPRRSRRSGGESQHQDHRDNSAAELPTPPSAAARELFGVKPADSERSPRPINSWEPGLQAFVFRRGAL